MAHLPLKYKKYYEQLRHEYPSMSLVFERNECCEEYKDHRYSIADWYGGGHFINFRCTKCGHEWWEDDMEWGPYELDE